MGYTLILYMTLIIAVVTLIPFSFAVPRTIHFALYSNASDFFINIALFVPLGFLFQITHRNIGWTSFFGALCFGSVISGVVEVGQLFLPSRCSSVIDLITNGLGAGLGAMIVHYHRLMVRHVRIPEHFGLGLPLLSSVYLLIPLLWLGGLSMGNEMSRLGLMGLVGVYGGGVIASVVVNRFRHRSGRWIGLAVVGYSTGWFMIGATPALTHFPLAVVGTGLMVGVIARLSCPIWKKQLSMDRRFELPTLKWLLPIYLSYLFLLSVWPTTVPLAEWSSRGDFPLLDQTGRILFISRFVEEIAAFTLLGYLLAEMSGRRKETSSIALTCVFLYTVGVFVAMAALRNLCFAKPLYLPVEGGMAFAAAMCGTIIYRLQLAVVKSHGEKAVNTTDGGKGGGR